MALGTGIIGTIVKSALGAIIGAINNWIQARKAAHAKAKAEAFAAREDSAERAENAEDSIDSAAQAEKEKPAATTDDSKFNAIEGFLEENINEDD